MSDTKKHQYKKPEEILTPFQLAAISPCAARLYSRIWNLMAFRGVNEIWSYDTELYKGTKLNPRTLADAKAELHMVGLMCLTPGTVQTHYRFLGDSE